MADTALDDLIDALRRLPGVGQKSAQRMAYHLLQHDRDGAQRIAGALGQALGRIRHCERCHTFSEAPVCGTCRDPERDASQLCVVETPADQAAMERSGSYRGLYFVLMCAGGQRTGIRRPRHAGPCAGGAARILLNRTGDEQPPVPGGTVAMNDRA